jgi:hypothetical protein
MTQLAKQTARTAMPATCRDRIEEAVIRAYVRLACAPDYASRLRTIIVAQFGALEVRMTESPLLAPPLRIEIYSHEVDAVLGRGDYFEFDEDELDAAVELIVSAQGNQRALN